MNSPEERDRKLVDAEIRLEMRLNSLLIGKPINPALNSLWPEGFPAISEKTVEQIISRRGEISFILREWSNSIMDALELSEGERK